MESTGSALDACQQFNMDLCNGILKAYWQRIVRAFIRSTITIHAKFFRHREVLIDLAVTDTH